MLPSVVSTLFPHLPRGSLRTFRLALTLGLLFVGALGLLGLFPLALVLATVLVPLLVLLYLFDVDVYEDAPIRVVGLTMALAAVAGSLLAVAVELLAPSGAAFLAESAGDRALVRGLGAPLLGAALMVAGPLALLRNPRWNDVLDGTTFAAASAVAFVSAQILVQSHDALEAGLFPAGERWAWILRLFELAVALPVLAAGAIGAAVGAIWIRFRARKRREGLGILAHPVVAICAAVGLLVAASFGQLFLPWEASFASTVLLALAALVWLRLVIHVGLLDESSEGPIGAATGCANCGAQTPRHTFCGNCGIALHALPKRREPNQALLFAAFAALVVVVSLVVMTAVRFAAENVAAGACPVGRPCEPPGGSPLGSRRTWTSRLGFALEYPPSAWKETSADQLRLRLRYRGRESMMVRSVLTRDAKELYEDELDRLERAAGVRSLEESDRTERAMLGPSLGGRSGVGGIFCTHVAAQGVNTYTEVFVLAATDGRASAVVTLYTDHCGKLLRNSDTLMAADSILNTFTWSPNSL